MTRASSEFQVFAKPVGAHCNLDCSYCYYLEKKDLYPHAASARMPEDLLEKYIVQHFQACPIPTVLFSWHGGESTLLGLDYFRKIVALQRRHCPPGREFVNDIQTNGTLLDEQWARFLATEGFSVGLSLDGPAEWHDRCRVSKGGKPTHAQVVAAYQLLRRFGVDCTVLCVVSDANVHRPLEVYRFFKDLGAHYLVFLPLVRRTQEGGLTSDSVPAEAFGEFLCAVFDEWLRHDVGHVYIQMFEEAVRTAQGEEHTLCVFRRTCGELPVLEHNGDFYSCDHFVDKDHFLGNLREVSLLQVLEGAPQRAFGRAKWDSVPRQCHGCDVLEYCNGGCPKDRMPASPDGVPGVNILCAGYRRFFRHARPAVRRLAGLISSGRPAEHIAESSRNTGPGRNDPCPCGSGKKFKKCCRNGGQTTVSR